MQQLKLLFFIIFLNCTKGIAQDLTFAPGTKIFIVRHAEEDTGANANLTAAGRKRAGDLMRFLKDKNIKRVFTTSLKRSIQTADSLRALTGVGITIYKPDTTGNDLYVRIKSGFYEGEAILIVSRYKLIPTIIKSFGVDRFERKKLHPNQYNLLFELEYKKQRVKFRKYRYGDKNPEKVDVPF